MSRTIEMEGRLSSTAADGIETVVTDSNQTVPRRILGPLGWNSLAALLPVAVQLLLTPYLLLRLGSDRFGLVGLVMTIVGIVSSFDGGIGSSALRWFSIYSGRGDKAATSRLLATLFLVVVGLGTLGMALLVPFSALIASWLHTSAAVQHDGRVVLKLLSPVVAITLTRNLGIALLRANGAWRVTVTQSVASALAFGLTAFTLVSQGMGVLGLVLAILLQQAVGLASVCWACRRIVDVSSLRPAGLDLVRDFFGFAGRMQVVTLVDVFNLEFDMVLAGFVLPLRTVAYYSIGMSVATQIRALCLNVLPPLASRWGAMLGTTDRSILVADYRRLQAVWIKAIGGLMAVSVPGVYFIVEAWLHVPSTTPQAVATVLLGGMATNLVLTGALSTLLRVLGKGGIEARYALITLALNVSITVALLGPLGALGIAVGTGAGSLLGSLWLVRASRTYIGAGMGSPYRDIPAARVALAAAFVVGAEFFVRGLDLTGPAALAVAVLPCLVALSLYVASFQRELREEIRREGHIRASAVGSEPGWGIPGSLPVRRWVSGKGPSGHAAPRGNLEPVAQSSPGR